MADYKDPVCKTTVTDECETQRHTYKGQTYYFCSAACRQMFVKDPVQYVRTERNKKEVAV